VRRAELPVAGRAFGLAMHHDRLLVTAIDGGLWSFSRTAIGQMVTRYGAGATEPSH
jgi:hypothetical protein